MNVMRAAILVVALIVVACAPAPLEFADWTIPVPDGTPLEEHEVALLDERDGDRIELVEDLVIGRGGGEADEAFYRARDLVVDADGRIYVLDSGNHRVQVFEADGTFLRSFGKEGQGPGEFVRPDWIALAGDVYLAAGDQYQVFAFAPSGDPRWALRTNMPMPPFPTARIDDRVRRNERAASRSDYDWDEFLPAIEAIHVDGHGHLWVYPTVGDPVRDAPEEPASPETRPVDVYSSDGRLLYSGAADSARWHVSFGEFVYALTVDGDAGEQIVVRYRVVEPFD